MPSPNAALLALAAAAEGGGKGLLSVDATLLWATIVVFLIFAFVLGRFAWRPLLSIIDEREKSIREQIDGAGRAAEEARELLAKHQELLRSAGRERDEMLVRTVQEADQARADLVAKARGEAERLIARAREQMQRETEQTLAELRAEVAEIAIEAASRVVKSSLSPEVQRQIVDDYIRSLPRAQ